MLIGRFGSLADLLLRCISMSVMGRLQAFRAKHGRLRPDVCSLLQTDIV